MSNKRNRRRYGQRVRAEVSRKPRKLTKSMDAFIAAQPAERERKLQEERWSIFTVPTRKQIKATSRAFLHMRGYKWRRKPRTKYGRTYWNHSHDI